MHLVINFIYLLTCSDEPGQRTLTLKLEESGNILSFLLCKVKIKKKRKEKKTKTPNKTKKQKTVLADLNAMERILNCNAKDAVHPLQNIL